MIPLMSLWMACWGGDAFIVEGTVIEVASGEVVLDHEAVPGLMGPMVMAFAVADPAMLDGLEAGHQVVARYELGERSGRLTKLRITGKVPVPQVSGASLRPGQALDPVDVALHDGSTLRLGTELGSAIAITFVYTRCPLPEACPALVARLAALADQLDPGEPVRLLAISLDPEHDTVPVLAAFAETVQVTPQWHFGRVDADVLARLALAAGMTVVQGEDGEIIHGLRLLVFDAQGSLVERYDDPRFPGDRVLQQLRTGGPAAPRANSGTISP